MQRALQLTDSHAASIGLDTTPLDTPGWNSLAHVRLILEVENAFDVTFEADEIGSMASVAAIMNALERRSA